MKILLVNDAGQTVAQVSDVERYDGSLAGHTAGLLDLLEALIAASKPSGKPPGKPLGKIPGAPPIGGMANLAGLVTSRAESCESPR